MNTNVGYTFLDTHRIGFNLNYYKIPKSGEVYGGQITNGHYQRENYLYGIEYTGSTPNEIFSW
jgi:hypothetical protein